MRIGESVKKRTTTGNDSRTKRTRTGRVVYINHCNGWYMAEFHVRNGTYRECFWLTKEDT